MKKIKHARIYKGRLLINYKLQLMMLIYSTLLATAVSMTNLVFQLAIVGKLSFLGPNYSLVIPWVILFLFALIILFGLILSNRIAGPIYRLKMHMDSVIEGGEPGELKFRQDDYFSEIVPSYNQLIGMVKGGKAPDGEKKAQ